MRKDWKYIMYVAGAISLFVAVKLLAPKQYDWSVSLAHDDKDPYGAYALNALLPDLFKGKHINNSYQTLYELKDSLQPGENVMIFGSQVSCDKEDAKVLLQHVAGGGTAFISAEHFWGHLPDTLNIGTYDYFFNRGDVLTRNDTAYLKFTNRHFDTTSHFFFKRDNIHNYFERFDTTRTTVIARNDHGRPVTIRMAWGKGYLVLNSTPLVFTNIYLLAASNHEFVSKTMSYLQQGDVQWTEYYHLGRMESRTPLRFILTSEPLSWAYYIIIFSMILFMLFEAKRKQRIIPVVKPLANTSLEFVSTIGNLYYQNGDHKNLAEKKISFLLEQIRAKYMLKTNVYNDEFISALASKSGNTKEDVMTLFRTISFISSSTMISAGQLVDLNNKIEQFNAAVHASRKVL
jgi:hypothetical protein